MLLSPPSPIEVAESQGPALGLSCLIVEEEDKICQAADM